MMLIDVDDFLDLIDTENQRCVISTGHDLTIDMVRSFIKHQPTAYDVDKVVKELEKYRKIMESPIIENCFEKECDCSDCTVCCFNKAIEIVKSGLNTENGGLRMDKETQKFIDYCNNAHTTVAVFIKLFNLWAMLSSEQRGEIIESEIAKGRLDIE